MEKKDLKERTKSFALKIIKVVELLPKGRIRDSKERQKMSKYSAFRNPHPAIGKSCMMKNLISGLKYSAFRNPHSAIGNKGFTLIEIIVMIVMAGILLPVIIVPFATGIKKSTKPEMVTRAMYLGHQRMEELMKYVYGNAALNVTGVGIFVPFATGDPNYLGEYEIVYVNANLVTRATSVGYKRITVRVTDPESDIYEIYTLVTDFP